MYVVLERWVRYTIFLKVYPNYVIRAMLYAEEFLEGLSKYMPNPFTYESVRLKPPDTPEYDTCLLWLSAMDNSGLLDTILDT